MSPSPLISKRFCALSRKQLEPLVFRPRRPRRERIQRVVDLLVANHKDLTEAINEDFGGRIPGPTR